MKSFKVSTFSFLLLFVFGQLSGQGTFDKAADSDPAATKILDKLKKEYDSYKSLYVDFDLILDLPQQDSEIQKGYMKQSGDKFVAKMGDQEVYCNGKNLWVYLPSNNEVQINDFNPKDTEGMLSPKDLLRIYENGNYAYAITGEEVISGKRVTLIEFKPLDKNSEYSKMRLAVDAKSNRAQSIKVFSKDGSRYTLNIKKFEGNKAFEASTFTFDSKKYPGVRVEDLRID